MRKKIIVLFIVALIPQQALAAQAAKPKPVEVQGTVDVNVVSPDPLPVEVNGGLSVESLPAVELAPDQAVGIAPNQQVSVREMIIEPSELVLVQSFIGTNSAESKLVSMPMTMILRTITVVPSSIDTDPNLYNCGATVRWPLLSNPTDPSSTDRIIAHHKWQGTNHIAFNYAMPYNVKLVQGSQIETSVGRVGSSGFCEAVIILTGTKVGS